MLKPLDSPRDIDRSVSRSWLDDALATLEHEAMSCAETPVHLFPLPPEWNIDLYVKDESVHPTGSLKHRLARALISHGLCSGWIGEDTTLVDASSGSTAISEAFFARLLNLPFVAVLPRSTTAEKIRLIEREGGTCHLVTDPSKVDTEARRIAGDIGGHYLNQFTYAERATDWRSENNIAAEIYRQLSGERYPLPEWVVVGAGTGGTSTTIGRYVRLRHFDTRVLVVDPDHSAFFESWTTGNTDARANGSAIEGIGRPCWEPSFVLSTVDRMMSVPDASSIAAMRLLRDRTGLVGGGSSGTALFGALRLIDEMHREGVAGSIVSILCDRGDRYATTCYDDVWVREQGWDINTPMARLESFLTTGYWS